MEIRFEPLPNSICFWSAGRTHSLSRIKSTSTAHSLGAIVDRIGVRESGKSQSKFLRIPDRPEAARGTGLILRRGPEPARSHRRALKMSARDHGYVFLRGIAPLLVWAQKLAFSGPSSSPLAAAVAAAQRMSLVSTMETGDPPNTSLEDSAYDEKARDAECLVAAAEEKSAEACKMCLAELGNAEGNWESLRTNVRAAYLISCVVWAATIIWGASEDKSGDEDRAAALRLLDLALLAVKSDTPLLSLPTCTPGGAAAGDSGQIKTEKEAARSDSAPLYDPRETVRAAAVALHDMLASPEQGDATSPGASREVGEKRSREEDRACAASFPEDSPPAGGAGGERDWAGAGTWRDDGTLGVGGVVAGAGEGARVRAVDAGDRSKIQEAAARREPLLLRAVTRSWPAAQRWRRRGYLCRAAGRRTVPVEAGSYSAAGSVSRLMRFGDFLDALAAPRGGEEEPGYLAQHDLFDQVRSDHV